MNPFLSYNLCRLRLKDEDDVFALIIFSLHQLVAQTKTRNSKQVEENSIARAEDEYSITLSISIVWS